MILKVSQQSWPNLIKKRVQHLESPQWGKIQHNGFLCENIFSQVPNKRGVPHKRVGGEGGGGSGHLGRLVWWGKGVEVTGWSKNRICYKQGGWKGPNKRRVGERYFFHHHLFFHKHMLSICKWDK